MIRFQIYNVKWIHHMEVMDHIDLMQVTEVIVMHLVKTMGQQSVLNILSIYDYVNTTKEH